MVVPLGPIATLLFGIGFPDESTNNLGHPAAGKMETL